MHRVARTKRTKAVARGAEMEAQKRRDDATVNLCGAQRHDGKFCAQRAGWGTEHLGRGRCRHHGGQLRSGLAAAADEEMRGMAKPTPVSPGQALSGVLGLAAGQLVYASGQVAELPDDELFERAYSPTEGVFKHGKGGRGHAHRSGSIGGKGGSKRDSRCIRGPKR